MISAAIIGIPPRKRVVIHDRGGGYGQIKKLGGGGGYFSQSKVS